MLVLYCKAACSVGCDSLSTDRRGECVQVSALLGVTANQRLQVAQLRVTYLRLLGRMTRQRLQLVASLQVGPKVAPLTHERPCCVGEMQQG